MTQGTVKWFNPVKGFGYIAPEGGSTNTFVHISAVKAAGLTDLQEDQTLQYNIVESPAGSITSHTAENLVMDE